LSM
jgi:hypothetical protein